MGFFNDWMFWDLPKKEIPEGHRNALAACVDAIVPQKLLFGDAWFPVVTLCGSTKFGIPPFNYFNRLLSGLGFVVLGPSVNMKLGVHADELKLLDPRLSGDFFKHSLDVLHKKKISMSAVVLVLNIGGYIGESTAAEIAWAKDCRIPIVFLEPVDQIKYPGLTEVPAD